jgi:NADH-quinone oxidoreductase subunit G
LYAAAPDENLVDASHREPIAAVVQALRDSRRPVIVCGTDIVPPQIPALAADLTLLLNAAGKRSGLFYVLPGANAFGSALVANPQRSFLQILDGIENGEIKALILTECDPFSQFADRKRLQQAIDQLELLIVLDYLYTEAVAGADLFLPTATIYEAGGLFINQEGRLQVIGEAYRGGLPIVQSGGGDHPPRFYDKGVPGAEPRPAWQLLAGLADKDPGIANDRVWLADIISETADLPAWDDIPDDGIRLHAAINNDLRFERQNAFAIDKAAARDKSLALMLVDWTFGTEELSSYAACLQELESDPWATMHSGDAADLGLNAGDRIRIETDSGSLELILRVADSMAAGVLVVPRHRRLNWQNLGSGKVVISTERINKVG